MAKDMIRYDLLVQDALKGVVRKLLAEVARDGLPGEHHFYISFRTDYPGVRLSQRLRDKYPQEMTIVLQHQFWDLILTDHTVEVGLSFSGVPERLLVPFSALTGFFDPSVSFGLKFEPQEDEPMPAEPQPGLQRPTRGAGSEPIELQPKPQSVPAVAKPAARPAAEPRPKAEGKGLPKPEKPVAPSKTEAPDKEKKEEEEEAGSAEVVSLDAFRKKS